MNSTVGDWSTFQSERATSFCYSDLHAMHLLQSLRFLTLWADKTRPSMSMFVLNFCFVLFLVLLHYILLLHDSVQHECPQTMQKKCSKQLPYQHRRNYRNSMKGLSFILLWIFYNKKNIIITSKIIFFYWLKWPNGLHILNKYDMHSTFVNRQFLYVPNLHIFLSTSVTMVDSTWLIMPTRMCVILYRRFWD